ncbi:MAG: hypothetical protein IPH69_00790 [Bacteroidales bacterium]|nr:hypothetical protein [Bacteroidales bacterium]
MKTRFSFWFCILIFVSSVSLSQVPRGFNYMAIARNLSGEILKGTDLKIRIAILKSTDPLVYVWEEEHIVKTDDFGQFKLIVGDPEAVWTEPPGGVEKFPLIDWNVQPLYIRTSILNGEVWEVMGDAQLFSVPYSLVSQNLSGANKLSVAGTTTNMDEALFEVKNHLDQTVFAVYGDGVRMYVGDRTAKGAKGGFAIGEFGAKGKADIQEYFTITPYEARINMNPPLPGKAPKGGFAIGEFGAKGLIPTSFMDVTPKNYFIGHESGLNISSGLYNSFIGYQAGYNTTTGGKNYFIGYKAGFSNTIGFSNTFIGDSAGYKNINGYFNTFIGNWAGFNNTSGIKNLIIGHRAGFNNTSGICNVFLGPDAGGKNSTAWYNTFVGIGAGYNTTTGGFNSYYGINSGYAMSSGVNNAFFGSNSGYWFDGGSGNTFIGAESGRGGPDNDPPDAAGSNNTALGVFTAGVLESASNNTMLGAYSGAMLRTGTGNVFLGYGAGFYETGSNKLYISNSLTNNIIYGDFSTGNIGIGTTALPRRLNVSGDAEITGNLEAGSITGPVDGDLTGNVTGNLSGNVTGNVTGDLTGNVTGNINGMTMGKVYLTANGNIATAYGTYFTLYWNKSTGEISIINTHPTDYCDYWFQTQKGSTTAGNASGIPGATTTSIIFGTNTNGYGFEVHFGIADGQLGWCSVWLQYANGTLVGHYIKY